MVHFGLSGRRVEWRHRVDPDYACLRPERDVVVPPVADYAIAKSGDTAKLYEFAAGHGGSDNHTRHMLFFFAGGVNMHVGRGMGAGLLKSWQANSGCWRYVR